MRLIKMNSQQVEKHRMADKFIELGNQCTTNRYQRTRWGWLSVSTIPVSRPFRGNTLFNYQSPRSGRGKTPESNQYHPQDYQQWHQYPSPNYYPDLRNEPPMYNRYQPLADEKYYGSQYNQQPTSSFLGQQGRGEGVGAHRERIIKRTNTREERRTHNSSM